MSAGRKPQPTVLRLIKGNPGKRPINQNEPKPEIKAPACPDFLSVLAKQEWARIVPQLEKIGLVSEIDMSALAAYCDQFAIWVEATQKLQQHGMIIKSPSGYPIQSPYLSIANKAVERMKSFLTELGMTPSSRSRLSVSGKAKNNKFDNI